MAKVLIQARLANSMGIQTGNGFMLRAVAFLSELSGLAAAVSNALPGDEIVIDWPGIPPAEYAWWSMRRT